jgi:predicted nucleic acid-binding Zn ribbon protein
MKSRDDKKCSDSTREILASEKSKVMKEALEYLKQLREALNVKQVA